MTLSTRKQRRAPQTHMRGPARAGARPRLDDPAFRGLDRATRRRLAKSADFAPLGFDGEPREPHLHRFRFALVPWCWMAGALAGLVLHGLHAYLVAAVAALLTVVIAAVTTSGVKHKFARRYLRGMAAWVACWAVILALAGLGWWAGFGLLGWAVPSAAWLERYRWKGPVKPERRDTSVEDTWNELAMEQKWAAWLGPPVPLPGGNRWPVICRGAKTHIIKIADKRDEVAAAFDTTIVQAYVEPREDGVRSRGWLTILRESTLDTPRPWDGVGIDPKTGLAVVGRFPEGGDLHESYYVPGVGGGTRHAIVAGCDGSGKTGLLDLGMCISVSSGMIAPVILDPQMGQAMPAWQDHVPTARGADECMAYLRGLYSAMMGRSEFMASLRWQHPRTGRMRRGMGFYAPDVLVENPADGKLVPLGQLLPIIEVVIDEAPILLAMKGAPDLVLNIAKLGRKTGFRVKLAAQVPSIQELGKSELRSILVGGNVFCLRTGDKVTGGMTNIPARPNELPKFFPNGKPTRGLGYSDTIEQRPGVTTRADWIEEERLYDFAESHPVRGFDDRAAERLRRAVALEGERVAALTQAANDLAAQELAALQALTGPMPMGELIVTCPGLSVSQVVDAVGALEKAGRVRRHDGVVEPV